MLVNKKGITDLHSLQVAEEEALALAYKRLFAEIRADTPLSCALVRHIHSRIFGDLYDWAGRWRTVNISRPGITWPPPGFIHQNMEVLQRDVLSKYPASVLSDDDAFCRAAAAIQGEFLVIHPFREGNARTIKLLTDLLAAQASRPALKYDESDAGRDAYIASASAAFKRDYRAMEQVIRRALREGRRER